MAYEMLDQMEVTALGSLETEEYDEHYYATLEFRNIPKIVEIMLNSRHNYSVSLEDSEVPNSELQKKWYPIFLKLWKDKYSDNPKYSGTSYSNTAWLYTQYLLDVFTPVTILYTASVECLKRTLILFNDLTFELRKSQGYLAQTLLPVLENLIDPMAEAIGLPIDIIQEYTGEIFDVLQFQYEPNEVGKIITSTQQFGESYCISYQQSFLYLGDVVRRRRLKFTGQFSDEGPNKTSLEFYVPDLLFEQSLYEEWVKDISSLDGIPLGRKLNIVEQGCVSDFCRYLEFNRRKLHETTQRDFFTLQKFNSNKDRFSIRTLERTAPIMADLSTLI